MNDEVCLTLSEIGKCYGIYANPRERFFRALTHRFPFLDSHLSEQSGTEFWALRDISLQIKQGEAVGIVGMNGAGKSTLLQIITGVLEPSEGELSTRGRITSLLELGSGFDPDFTGRENVYLNGQVLGLSKGEIDVAFDEIAAFADIDDFLEQPVKVYSSGMLMRLAFAVQTALDPDILIVDEALSVGDIYFQAKCMRRMLNLKEQGTTILYVSHALSTVREFCDRAILLHHGKLICDDDPTTTTYRFMALQTGDEIETARVSALKEATPLPAELVKGQETFLQHSSADRLGNGQARFLNVVLLSEAGEPSDSFEYDEQVTCMMVVEVTSGAPCLLIGYKIRTHTGTDIIHADTGLLEQLDFEYREGGVYVLRWHFNMRLVHGTYGLGVSMATAVQSTDVYRHLEYVDVIALAATFDVSARQKGMIGATAVWDNSLVIQAVEL